MFANVTIRTRLALLLAFVNALLFAAAGYAWYAIARLNDQLVHTIRVQELSDDAMNSIRGAQLAYKIQVQEWKNMLLRSQDAILFDQVRKGFSLLTIQPAEGADSAMTLAQLFANGPIQITLLGGTGRRVKMGIEAPEQLAIRRKDPE